VLGLLAVLLAALAGCKQLRHADTRPLDQVGMRYSAIKELQQLDITDTEVAELVKVKQAGFSDDAALELVHIARGRKIPFTSGDAVEKLRQVGISEDTVLELARLDQLGLWVGEAQAMRLAGISEAIILELARLRAAGKPTLSGTSLAEMKNVGLSDSTLLELVRRGVTDDQTDTITTLRRRGWSEQQILGRYPAR
jgi:hypothetical protein